VCTGAFVLAEAGLLDGRRVATHWAACQLLRERFPGCEVDDDALFVRDGQMWTAAGVTSGIDLALQLVEDDHGQQIAARVARWLVVYLRRAGGQNQFSALSFGERSRREPLRTLGAWVAENLRGDLSLERLAAHVGMSSRSLTRVFRAELGTSPAAYVERIRLEVACHALETTDDPLKAIADRVGFGTPESLHRAFRRRLSVTPGEYRARFVKPRAPE
jgi:transcriptional regulator GlxA family with amidase domain